MEVVFTCNTTGIRWGLQKALAPIYFQLLYFIFNHELLKKMLAHVTFFSLLLSY